jgi:hypothetical protein
MPLCIPFWLLNANALLLPDSLPSSRLCCTTYCIVCLMLTQAAPGITAGKRHSPMDALAAKQAALASILSVGSVGSTMASSPKASLQAASSFPDGATPGSNTFVPAPVAATISSPKQALVAARHRQQAAALAQAQAQVQAQSKASSPRSAASSPRAHTSGSVAAASSSPQAATLAAIGRQTSAAEHETQHAIVQAPAAHAVLMKAKAERQAAELWADEQARQAAEAAGAHESMKVEPLSSQHQLASQQAEITAADEQLPMQQPRPSSRSAAAKMPAPVVWDQPKPRPALPEPSTPTAADAGPAGPAATAATAGLSVQTEPRELAPVPRSGNIIADPNPPPEAAASSTSADTPVPAAPAQTPLPAAAAVASAPAEQVRKQYACTLCCMPLWPCLPVCTPTCPVSRKPAVCTQP